MARKTFTSSREPTVNRLRSAHPTISTAASLPSTNQRSRGQQPPTSPLRHTWKESKLTPNIGPSSQDQWKPRLVSRTWALGNSSLWQPDL